MKTLYPGHTRAGSAMTEFFLEAFRLRGALIDAGDRISRPLGLTAARWQVLSSVARAPQPSPVAHIARELGLARQSVQRLTDHLVTEGLLDYRDNPHHRRAPLVMITSRGKKVFDQLTLRQVHWVNALSSHVNIEAIEATVGLMRSLVRRLKSEGKQAPPPLKRRRPRKRAK